MRDQEEAHLEEQLTNRLRKANNNEKEKLQAFNHTFNEIIQRDKHFGRLLNKIKSAYDEYLTKHIDSEVTSPGESQTVEDLKRKIEMLD